MSEMHVDWVAAEWNRIRDLPSSHASDKAWLAVSWFAWLTVGVGSTCAYARESLGGLDDAWDSLAVIAKRHLPGLQVWVKQQPARMYAGTAHTGILASGAVERFELCVVPRRLYLRDGNLLSIGYFLPVWMILVIGLWRESC